MTERDFVYWLQGFLEISSEKMLTEAQVQIVRDHLKLVLTKVVTSKDMIDFSKIDFTKTTGPHDFPTTVIC